MTFVTRDRADWLLDRRGQPDSDAHPAPVRESWLKVDADRVASARVPPPRPGARAVISINANPDKQSEFERVFSRYGIRVLSVDPSRGWDPIELLRNPPFEHNIIAVFSEVSTLELTDLRSTQHSSLDALWKDKTGGLHLRRYSAQVVGKPIIQSPVPDWWDPLFIPVRSERSFSDLAQAGSKRSARDRALSSFVRDRIHYDERIVSSVAPSRPKRTIDFTVSPRKCLEGVLWPTGATTVALALSRLREAVLDSGIFFRAPRTRPERNYWNPGLNGGVPFTKKPDLVHESTYFVHDLFHQLTPDLTLLGDSKLGRQVYAASRMLSEVFSLVLADMLYVHGLRESGVVYDFDQRGIYPVLRESGLDFASPDWLDDLKELCRAVTAMALKGDSTPLERMVQRAGGDVEVVAEFRDVYERFFVADYVWTDQNAKNMTGSAWRRDWWQATAELRAGIEPILLSAEELGDAIGLSEAGLVDALFEHLFESRLRPILEGRDVDDGRQSLEGRRSTSIARYASGQAALFFWHAQRSGESMDADFQRYLAVALDAACDPTDDNIATMRAEYEQTLERLVDRCTLSPDEAQTYAEMFPLFPPTYVSYDEGKGFDENVSGVAERVLGSPALEATRPMGPRCPILSGLTVDELCHLALRRLTFSASQSLRVHPLGFIQVTLVDSPDIRMNVWPKGHQLDDGNEVHNHTFGMHSRVLLGGIGNRIFAFEEDPGGQDVLTETRYDGDLHILTDTGRRGTVVRRHSELVGAGDEYFLPKGQLHGTFEGSAELTVTVISRMENDWSDGDSNVVVRDGLDPNGTFVPVTYEEGAAAMAFSEAHALAQQAIREVQKRWRCEV